jgi:hypothetical protein
MANEIIPAAEFQALPLEFVLVAPLTGVVKAQAIVAQNILAFVESFKDKTVNFKAEFENAGGNKQKVEVNAPLLSVVPVPHLRIDSLTVSFKYEISQVVADKKDLEMGMSLEGGTTGIAAKFFNASLKGSVSSKSSSESTTNRSGSLEVTLHASEAPIPEGLQRILSLLAKAVPEVKAT